jgi:hypothetical protein
MNRTSGCRSSREHVTRRSEAIPGEIETLTALLALKWQTLFGSFYLAQMSIVCYNTIQKLWKHATEPTSSDFYVRRVGGIFGEFKGDTIGGLLGPFPTAGADEPGVTIGDPVSLPPVNDRVGVFGVDGDVGEGRSSS